MSDSEIVSHSPPGPPGTDTKGNPAEGWGGGGIVPHPGVGREQEMAERR
jgi:hypothetical protein